MSTLLTSWTNKGEVERVEKENDIFLPNVFRELNLQWQITWRLQKFQFHQVRNLWNPYTVIMKMFFRKYTLLFLSYRACKFTYNSIMHYKFVVGWPFMIASIRNGHCIHYVIKGNNEVFVFWGSVCNYFGK